MGHLRSTYPPELGHHHHCTLLQLGTTTVHWYYQDTTNDMPPPHPPGPPPPLLTDQCTTTATPPPQLPPHYKIQILWHFTSSGCRYSGRQKVQLKPLFISLYWAESVVGLYAISWSRKGDSLATRGWVGEHGISGHQCTTLHSALYNTVLSTAWHYTVHCTILHCALYNTAPCTV